MTSSRKVITEPPIDSLTFLGKSWYKRGILYWIRRVLVALFFLALTCMICAMAVGFTIGIIDSGVPAWVAIPLMTVASLVSSIANGRSMARRHREQSALDDQQLVPENRRKSPEERRARRAGAGAGALGYGLSVLGGLGSVITVVCTPVAVGLFALLLWYNVQPLAPGELRARRKVVRWLALQGRQDEIPTSWEMA